MNLFIVIVIQETDCEKTIWGKGTTFFLKDNEKNNKSLVGHQKGGLHIVFYRIPIVLIMDFNHILYIEDVWFCHIRKKIFSVIFAVLLSLTLYSVGIELVI